MTVIPIRGRRENIKAELIAIANDETVTGIAICIIRGDARDQVMTTLSMGPGATRANLALASVWLASDAISQEDD